MCSIRIIAIIVCLVKFFHKKSSSIFTIKFLLFKKVAFARFGQAFNATDSCYIGIGSYDETQCDQVSNQTADTISGCMVCFIVI
jgi:hypothetical protein